jgi:hypothetical protein
VKKLISIGVVLAVLALVVLPIGVAAQEIMPSTYAKIPFAIVQSGFYLVGCLLGDLGPILEAAGIILPFPLGDLTPIMLTVGDWAGVPLAWSVDMVAWGVGMLSGIVGVLPAELGVPSWIGLLLDEVVTQLNACFEPTTCNNVSNAYQVPCSP